MFVFCQRQRCQRCFGQVFFFHFRAASLAPAFWFYEYMWSTKQQLMFNVHVFSSCSVFPVSCRHFFFFVFCFSLALNCRLPSEAQHLRVKPRDKIPWWETTTTSSTQTEMKAKKKKTYEKSLLAQRPQRYIIWPVLMLVHGFWCDSRTVCRLLYTTDSTHYPALLASWSKLHDAAAASFPFMSRSLPINQISEPIITKDVSHLLVWLCLPKCYVYVCLSDVNMQIHDKIEQKPKKYTIPCTCELRNANYSTKDDSETSRVRYNLLKFAQNPSHLMREYGRYAMYV